MVERMAIKKPGEILDFVLRNLPGVSLPYSAYAKAETPIEKMQKAGSRGFIKSATLGYVTPDKEYKPEAMSEKAANLVGELSGFMVPYAGASKVAGGVGLAGKTFASTLGKQAAIGGALGLAEKPEEGDSRLKSAAQGAAMFPLFTVAGKALGVGAKKVLPAIAKKLLPKGLDPREARMAMLRSQRAGKVVQGVGEGKLDETKFKGLLKELDPYLSRTKKGELSGLVGAQPKADRAEPIFSKITTPKQQEAFTQKVFMDKMKTLGYEVIPASSKTVDTLLNFSNWANKLNEKTGTNINVRDWVRTSNKSQYHKKQHQSLIHSFDKEFAKSKVTGKDFAKMVDDQIDHPLVKMHKEITDTMGKSYQEAGGNFQFVKEMGYAPRRRSVYFSDVPTKTGQAAKTIRTAKGAAEMPRGTEEMSWVNRIDEPTEWLRKYSVEVQRQHLKSLVPELNQNVQQLRMLGLEGRANELMDQFSKASGIDKSAARKMFATNFLNKDMTKLDIEAALKINKIDNQDTVQKAYQAATRLMFKSWVGLSPTAHMKQYFQPWLVGSVEISPKYVKYGLSNRKALKKSQSSVWKRARAELAPPRTGRKYLEQTPAEEAAAQLKPGLEKAVKVVEYPGEKGMKLFTWQDVERNRSSIFWGGRQQALDKGITSELLQGLESVDQRKILDTMASKGLEEAAYEYGITRSLRANFMYSAFDKPLLLKGEIGKYIPFTTCGRNQWMRFYEDVSAKNIDQLTKRIVYPLITLGMIETVTGKEIPRAHPASALSAPFQASIAPAITQPIESLFRGRYKYAGKQALSAVPLAGLMQRTQKLAKKGPIRGVGLKNARGKSILDLINE